MFKFKHLLCRSSVLKIRQGSLKEQSFLGASPRPITNTPDYSANLYFMGMLQGGTGAGREASEHA